MRGALESRYSWAGVCRLRSLKANLKGRTLMPSPVLAEDVLVLYTDLPVVGANGDEALEHDDTVVGA